MRKCLFEDQIDDYLLNRLEGEAKDRFEEHYFNCSSCFARLKERNEIVSAVKTRGAWLFARDHEPARKAWAPAFDRISSFLTPRQWVTAAAAAGIILVAVFGALPALRHQGPAFVLSESEVVRGQSLTLISPVIDVKAVPAYFEWARLPQAAEYRISLANTRSLWSEITTDSRIAVPESVKKQMVGGEKYSWQVRAYSAKGTLIAVSSRVQFQIGSGN